MNFKVGDIIRRDVDTWLGSFEILDIRPEDNYVNLRNRETNDLFDCVKLNMTPPWRLYTPITFGTIKKHRMILPLYE